MKTSVKVFAGLSFAPVVAVMLLVSSRAVAADREQRFHEYDTRRMEWMQQTAAGEGLWGAIARMYLDQEIDEANRIVMETDFSKIYWARQTELIPLYEMFNADDGHRAKLLSREATDKIQNYLWERFQPGVKHARHYHFVPDQPWRSWGNQNHGFVYQTLFYTGANALKDAPKYADQFDPVKHVPIGQGVESYEKRPELTTISLADYAESARKYFRSKLLYTAQTGLWAEDMIYRVSNVEGAYNLAYHADDPVVCQRASMILDIHWLLYALQTVDDQFGGAQNRFKSHYAGYHPERGTGWFYFGGRPGSQSCKAAMVGDDLPPEIAYELLENPEKRGCFIHRERLPMLNGPAEMEQATYKYSYVTPEYVLGSYILQHLNFTGKHRYSEREFNGITFGQARAILRLGPGVSFQGYHCMQHGPVLLASWYGKTTPFLSIIRREGGGAEVDKPVREQGWLFGKAGDAYYALRPASGEFGIATSEDRHELQRFTFPESQDKRIPFVVHAGCVTEDGTFDNFKQKVLDNKLSYQDGIITYTDDKWGELRFNPTPAGRLYASNTLASWSVHSDPNEQLFPSGKVVSDGGQNYVMWKENKNNVMKSRDGGKTWALFGPGQPGDRDPGYSFAGLHDLMYAFGAFPAASGYRCILTSHQIRSAQLEDDMPKVLASTGQTFAVGTANGKLYTANSWRPAWDNDVTAADGTDNDIPIREIAAGKGRFVAVTHDDESSVILTFAEDGKTYDKITQGTNSSFDDLLLSDVAYSRDHKVFVAAGMADGSTKVFTSADGKEWELKKTLNEKYLHLEWAPGVFALVTRPAENATKANAHTSVDGNAWSSVELPPNVAGSVTRSFSSDGHRFFSVVHELDEQLRQIDGEPVPLPDKLFDSPYLTSDYDSGVITAKFGDRKLILDFNNNERRVE